jgi:ESS family glutamate:Na+ symporter
LASPWPLNIFLVVAPMNLRLWELAGLALPLSVIPAVQVIVVLLVGHKPAA